MATRFVTCVRRDDNGAITALCNPREPWSPCDIDTAIREIENHENRYRVRVKTAKIGVVHGRHGDYLRTIADRLYGNNLENLPND